jgi:hypothetical protein
LAGQIDDYYRLKWQSVLFTSFSYNSIHVLTVSINISCCSAGGIALSTLVPATVSSVSSLAKSLVPNLQIWSMHGLLLTVEAAGLSFVSHVQVSHFKCQQHLVIITFLTYRTDSLLFPYIMKIDIFLNKDQHYSWCYEMSLIDLWASYFNFWFLLIITIIMFLQTRQPFVSFIKKTLILHKHLHGHGSENLCQCFTDKVHWDFELYVLLLRHIPYHVSCCLPWLMYSSLFLHPTSFLYLFYKFYLFVNLTEYLILFCYIILWFSYCLYSS